MKKFVYICACILFAASLYAQTEHGRQRRAVSQQACNLRAMLQSAAHNDWLKARCLGELADYLRSGKKKNSEDPVLKAAAERARERYRILYQNHRRQEADKYIDAYNEFIKAWARDSKTPIICYDAQTGEYYACPDNLKVAASKKIDEQRVNQTRLLSNLTQAEYNELIKNSVKGRMLPKNFKRLAEKVQNASANHEDLSKFIETVVRGGSDPKDVRYVPTEVVNLAFMQYASSLAPTATSKLIQYTAAKYPIRVRYAAASAAAEYAKSYVIKNGVEKNNTNPDGHLQIDANQRKHILYVFNEVYSSLNKKDPSLELFLKILELRVARIYNASHSLPILDNSGSSAGDSEKTGAMVLALPLTGQIATRIGLSEWVAGAVSKGLSLTPGGIAATGSAVVELAPTAAVAAGSAVLVGGALYCFGEALNDAYAPTWKQQWRQQLDDALKANDTSAVAQEYQMTYIPGNQISAEIPAGYNVAVLPFTVHSSGNIQIVDTSVSQADTKTETKKAERTCVYRPAGSGEMPTNLQKKLKNFIATADEETGERWKNFIDTCFGTINPANTARCDAEREQILAVKKLENSFYACDQGCNKSMKLHVRAKYREEYGGWIPEAEYPLATASGIRDLFNFMLQWLGIKDSGTALGLSEKIIRGERFTEFIDNRLFRIRDGLHGEDLNNSFGLDNRGIMSPKPNQKPFSHFHVDYTCSYEPQEAPASGSGKAQACIPGASSGTKTYICNLAFYYCNGSGNGSDCLNSLGMGTSSIQ